MSGKSLQVPGYQVIKYLGSGAGSSIWSVRKNDTGQMYALKRVVRRTASDGRFLEQVEKEFEIATRLDHPNIRKCYEMKKVRKLFKVSEIRVLMEYCQGKSVQENRPTDVAETVRIFGEVAEALCHMHKVGLLHTDMKPNNIIVSDSGEVKIIDFGQSCEIGTVKERIQGTPDYIAPEQVDLQQLDPRTDVFNFGAALYWSLTGQAIKTVIPRQSDSIQLKESMNLAPITDQNPDVPPALSSLVTDCVSYHRSQRPNSMQPVMTKLTLISKQLERRASEAKLDPADDPAATRPAGGQS